MSNKCFALMTVMALIIMLMVMWIAMSITIIDDYKVKITTLEYAISELKLANESGNMDCFKDGTDE